MSAVRTVFRPTDEPRQALEEARGGRADDIGRAESAETRHEQFDGAESERRVVLRGDSVVYGEGDGREAVAAPAAEQALPGRVGAAETLRSGEVEPSGQTAHGGGDETGLFVLFR